jgi:hypothetical protein
MRPDDPRPSTASLIATYGFTVHSVGYGICSVPGCRCTTRLRNPWTYTVGLSGAGLPELVLMGLEPRAAHHAVSWVADERRASRAVPLDDPFVLDRVRVKLLTVPIEWVLADHDRMAGWFKHYATVNGGARLPETQQVVWADAAGLFPDDPGCAAWVVREQPILRDSPLHYPLRSLGRRPRHRRGQRRAR